MIFYLTKEFSLHPSTKHNKLKNPTCEINHSPLFIKFQGKVMMRIDAHQSFCEVCNYHASSTLEVSRSPVSQNNILSTKSVILIPSGINLSKVIETAVENCIKVFMLTLGKLLLSGMGKKRKINFNKFQTRTSHEVEVTGTHKNTQEYRESKMFLYKCSFML